MTSRCDGTVKSGCKKVMFIFENEKACAWVENIYIYQYDLIYATSHECNRSLFLKEIHDTKWEIQGE